MPSGCLDGTMTLRHFKTTKKNGMSFHQRADPLMVTGWTNLELKPSNTFLKQRLGDFAFNTPPTTSLLL